MTTPDLRPILQESIFFGPSLVTAENPLGFNDADGRNVTRRLDKPDCLPGWERMLDDFAAAGGQGVVHWQPSGHLPDRPQYQIDSHLIHPAVVPQFVAVNEMAHDRGLWVGSLLRPAELAVRRTWGAESAYQFTQFTDDIKRLLRERIAWLTDYGAGDAFYLDSFGFGDLDADIAKWLRQAVGPDVKLFTEAWSDRLGPYTGAYAQTPDGQTWLGYYKQLEVLRWLFPSAEILAVDTRRDAAGPFADRVEWGRQCGMAPAVIFSEVPARKVPDEVTT